MSAQEISDKYDWRDFTGKKDPEAKNCMIGLVAPRGNSGEKKDGNYYLEPHLGETADEFINRMVLLQRQVSKPVVYVEERRLAKLVLVCDSCHIEKDLHLDYNKLLMRYYSLDNMSTRLHGRLPSACFVIQNHGKILHF